MNRFEERDAIHTVIIELTELKRSLYKQAEKIQNREGAYWEKLSDDEINERVNEYDKNIEVYQKIIDNCIDKLMKMFGNDI